MFRMFHESRKKSFGFKCIANALIILLSFNISTVYALPQVSEVVSGSADFAVNGSTMQINASDNSIVNYNSFNIESNEFVNVTLPSNDSRMLNRVVGGDLSRLMGHLSSNGLFILVNPNGMLVGSEGYIDASKLILSTRDISNKDFLKGDFLFSKNSKGTDRYILNEGTINIKEGGFGVLIAGAVENGGTIITPMGKSVLAGGDAVRLHLSKDDLVSVTIDKPTASTIYDFDGNPITDQLSNTWEIQADGGAVIFKAEALPNIFEKAINLDGFVQANKLQNKNGVISLVSSGKVDVSGFVEAPRVEVGDSIIAADNLFIDQDFFGGLELVVTPKGIKNGVQVFNFDRNANEIRMEYEYFQDSSFKDLTREERIIDEKTFSIAGGTRTETDTKIQRLSLGESKTDWLYTFNGAVTGDWTQITKSALGLKSEQENTRETQINPNGSRTSSETKFHEKSEGLAVTYNLDNLNSKNSTVRTVDQEKETKSFASAENKTQLTGYGDFQSEKSKSLAVIDEHTVTTTQNLENPSSKVVLDSTSEKEVGEIADTTTKREKTNDGLKITKTIKKKSDVSLNKTDITSGNTAEVTTNSKEQKTLNSLEKQVTVIQNLARGQQVVTTNSKATSHTKENKQIDSQAGKTVSNTKISNDIKQNTDTQSVEQFSYQKFNTNIPVLKNPAVANGPKQDPVLIRDRITKEYREIETANEGHAHSKTATLMNWGTTSFNNGNGWSGYETITNSKSSSLSEYSSNYSAKEKSNRQIQDKVQQTVTEKVLGKNGRMESVQVKKLVSQPVQIENMERETLQKSSTTALSEQKTTTWSKNSFQTQKANNGSMTQQKVEQDSISESTYEGKSEASMESKYKFEYGSLKAGAKTLNTEFEKANLKVAAAPAKMDLAAPLSVQKVETKSNMVNQTSMVSQFISKLRGMITTNTSSGKDGTTTVQKSDFKTDISGASVINSKTKVDYETKVNNGPVMKSSYSSQSTSARASQQSINQKSQTTTFTKTPAPRR